MNLHGNISVLDEQNKVQETVDLFFARKIYCPIVSKDQTRDHLSPGLNASIVYWYFIFGRVI